MQQNDIPPDAGTAGPDVPPLRKLTDAQVFSRDPEDYSQEDVADTIARLSKIVARQRKARQDDAAIADLTAKIKKANKAKKSKTKLAADPLETKI